MKKFLSISMMALALVFASSCNKDDNEEPSAAKCVNTWVTDEVAVTDILPDDAFADIPAELQPVLEAQLNNLKFKAAVDLAADGTAKGGVLVEKTKLTLMETAIQSLLAQYADKIDPEILAQINEGFATVKPVLDNLKDGDLVGVPFTYTATPTDAESGKITVTFKETDDEGNVKDETTEVAYSGLSDNAVTFAIADEDGTQTFALKSASSANVTVGNFVDATAFKSLL